MGKKPSRNQVLEDIGRVVARCSGKPFYVITMNSQISDLGLDDLEMIELMMELEDNWGIDIMEEEVEEMRSVEDLVAYVRRKVSE